MLRLEELRGRGPAPGRVTRCDPDFDRRCEVSSPVGANSAFDLVGARFSSPLGGSVLRSSIVGARSFFAGRCNLRLRSVGARSPFDRRCNLSSIVGARFPSRGSVQPVFDRRCDCFFARSVQIRLRSSVRGFSRRSVQSVFVRRCEVSSPVGAISPSIVGARFSSRVGAIRLRSSVRGSSRSVQSVFDRRCEGFRRSVRSALRSSVRGLFAGRCNPPSIVGARFLRRPVRSGCDCQCDVAYWSMNPDRGGRL